MFLAGHMFRGYDGCYGPDTEINQTESSGRLESYISIRLSVYLQDDEMSWLDKSCLQLLVKRKDKPETLTFQVTNVGHSAA